MRSKEECIKIISGLYPPDQNYSGKSLGRELLLEAIYRQWRQLPVEILNEYASLCEAKENGL